MADPSDSKLARRAAGTQGEPESALASTPEKEKRSPADTSVGLLSASPPSPESTAQPASPPLDHLRRVLVCLDGTELSERGVPYARSLARTWHVGLTMLHVLEPPCRPGDHAPWGTLDWEVARAEARASLELARSHVAGEGLEVDLLLLQGNVPEQVVNEAARERVNLTVLTTRGERDPSGWRLGPTAQMVVARATGSLLVVPGHYVKPRSLDSEVELRRIAVALDGSLRAECALPVAARIARDHGGSLLLTHVVPSPEITCPALHTADDRRAARMLERSNAQAAEHYLAQLRTRLGSEGLQVETLLQRDADVRDALAETAVRRRIDLLVVSAHGRSGSCRSPYGSTTQDLVARGLVPLLIIQDVPPEEMEWQENDSASERAPARPSGLYREEVK